MNITITGNLGSGKSSVCSVLAKKGYEIIKAGELFRQVAEEKGMTVVELNELAKTDRSVDDMLDERSTRLGREKDHAVFDSRMAWHFVPVSFKVFLLTNVKESARRVFQDDSRNTEKYGNIDEAEKELNHRATMEKERFLELYGVNYFDPSNYNLVIETTSATPEEIADEILRNYELFQQEPFSGKIELNPSSLYPTKAFGAFSREFLGQCRGEEQQTGSLCGAGAVLVAERNGYLYILDGHHHMFAASAAGKKFVEVQIAAALQEEKEIPVWRKEELMEFEKFGQFTYMDYPEEKPVRNGYMIEW